MSFQLPPGVPLTEIPAGMPPPGVTPNLVNPPSLKRAIYGVCITLMAIGLLLAISSIGQHIRRLRQNDWVLLCAIVFSTAYTALTIYVAPKQVHQWDLPLSTYYDSSYLKILFVQNLFTCPSVFFAKASILALYLQLFKVKRTLKIAIIAAYVMDGLTYWIQLPLAAYYCAPHTGAPWAIQVGISCGKEDIWGIVQSCLATALDIFIFVLPISPILNLSMSPRRKMAVLGVFATGFLGIVASVISLVYKVKLNNSTDKGWAGGVVLLTVNVEMWIAVIVASMPGFAAFVKILDQNSDGVLSILKSPVWLLRSLMRNSGGRSTRQTSEQHDLTAVEVSRARELARMQNQDANSHEDIEMVTMAGKDPLRPANSQL